MHNIEKESELDCDVTSGQQAQKIIFSLSVREYEFLSLVNQINITVKFGLFFSVYILLTSSQFSRTNPTHIRPYSSEQTEELIELIGLKKW